MYKIVALFGEAGTGKDFMLNKVLAARPDWHKIISCTTRPKRQGEQHGVNYFYHTMDEFKEKINNKGTFNREQLKALIYLMGAWDAFHVIYFPSKRQRRKVYWQVFGQYREKEKLNVRNEKIKR